MNAMENLITLECTDTRQSTRYAVAAEALNALVFDPEAPAPTVKVVERFSGLDRTFEAVYEATDSAPDPDLLESGGLWYLVGEANGKPVWLSLVSNGS
jgi:hypothetical protein